MDLNIRFARAFTLFTIGTIGFGVAGAATPNHFDFPSME